MGSMGSRKRTYIDSRGRHVAFGDEAIGVFVGGLWVGCGLLFLWELVLLPLGSWLWAHIGAALRPWF